jgi:hypothetical protein
MVEHDVVWLYVPVDHLGYLMAVVERLQHVDEVVPHVLAHFAG